MNQLEQLRTMTVIVADTGEFDDIKQYKPTDATTNPSLILGAVTKPEYYPLVIDAVDWSKAQKVSTHHLLDMAVDRVFVNFGLEILRIIPGRISTEIDARLSFDVKGSIEKAKNFIRMYEAAGIDRRRILIKLAATWEGISAARQLEREGIHCNMTLLFSMPQAIAAAEAGVTLISPFVGRILDWHRKHEGREFSSTEDPGVRSVAAIYNYYKHFDYKTQIMGASFRTDGEILELAGCDLLTISPKLLRQLQQGEGIVQRKLDPAIAKRQKIEKIDITENKFRLMMCFNPMASEKLHEGIVQFAKDLERLEDMIRNLFDHGGQKTS